jgi:hypothetical protein
MVTPQFSRAIAPIDALSPVPVVFAPHVETSAGIMVPDDYIKRLAEAAHAAGA